MPGEVNEQPYNLPIIEGLENLLEDNPDAEISAALKRAIKDVADQENVISAFQSYVS